MIFLNKNNVVLNIDIGTTVLDFKNISKYYRFIIESLIIYYCSSDIFEIF